ncbi:MAG: hypothetical protein ABJH68_21010 [Ilumatobacter sp.]|uniref:hypothetical protein n=1 Tax=Ilumatobacter sp. TaxID=1967498 RepID=UPI0032995D23
MAKYAIKEDGDNGSVEIDRDEIVRTHTRRLGRDDEIRIPLRTVTSVELDRQVGGDVVTVKTPGATYEWKLADDDAKQLAAEIETFRTR